MNNYSAFGLFVASEVQLDSLAVAGAPAPSPSEMVSIGWGKPSDPSAIAPLDTDGWFEFSGDRHRFGWSELGIVEIAAGRQVTVWPKKNVAEGLVEHVLLGPVFADILLTRGLLPLHASANRIGRGVVAFVGQSGRGKSTLAAALHAKGLVSYGDDLIGVPCDAPPYIHHGIARIKLNADSARATGTDPTHLNVVYAGIDKRSKPVLPPDSPDALPLLAIYRIAEDEDVRIAQVRPERALFELLPNVFRVEVEQHAVGMAELMRRCGRLLDQVPLFELRRPRDYGRLPRLVEAVVEHASRL